MVCTEKVASKAVKWKNKWGLRQDRFSRNKSANNWGSKWDRKSAKNARKFGEIVRENKRKESEGTKIEEFYANSILRSKK